jgi:hypothetical protein
VCLILGVVYLLIGAIAGAALSWLLSEGLWPDDIPDDNAIGEEAAHPSTTEDRR